MVASELSRLQEHLPASAVITPKWRYVHLRPHIDGVTAAGVGGGVGDPVFAEVGTTGVCGLWLQVDADTHTWMLALPDDVDVKKGIELALIWSSDQTTGDAYTFTLLYSELTVNVTAIIAGATALDTPIAADTGIATASAVQQTAWGVINGGSLSGVFSDGYLHTLTLVCTSLGGTPATDVVLLHGVVMRYKPRKV